MKKAEIIQKLVKHLNRCDLAYYNQTPLISDQDYDKLRDKLTSLDPSNPFLAKVGAPVVTTDGRSKHTHKSLIGSLAKCKTKEEFMKWAEGKGPLCVSYKYDGSTVVATYESGTLKTLATRGDGTIGEDITDNADLIGSKSNTYHFIPKQLTSDFTGEIRGEAILRLGRFEEFFKPAGYKNARNAANGKVRDMKRDDLIKWLEVVWFDIIPEDRDVKTEGEKWALIQELVNDDRPTTKSLAMAQIQTDAEKAWEIFEEVGKLRSGLDFEIDGIVVKVNDIDDQESFGVTSNRPNGAIAIKFPSLGAETFLESIEWNRGLTGVYAPTGILKSVDIGGVTIGRVSLCGMDEIRRLKIAPGDKVYITRRNDVIPKVEYVINRTPQPGTIRTPVKAPKTCNECDADLIQNGSYLICRNPDCQGEIFGSLMTWIQRLKIKGLGSSVLRSLIDEGVTDICKLYEAQEEVYEKATRSSKLAAKLYASVQSTTEVRLGTFLSGLCIPSLGATNGTRLEKRFNTLEAVVAASEEDLEGVPGIKTNAKKIRAGLDAKSDLIEGLAKILTIKTLDTSGPLAGHTVCVTGDLTVPRSKFQDWIRSLGGEVKSGVSKDLSYLITNAPASGTSKNKKADKYGVRKCTETDFYSLIGSSPA
tara:strand:- start:78905 stop:80842 length:1938 start_codon:yes stop_codon:yes gene_type:complete